MKIIAHHKSGFETEYRVVSSVFGGYYVNTKHEWENEWRIGETKYETSKEALNRYLDLLQLYIDMGYMGMESFEVYTNEVLNNDN